MKTRGAKKKPSELDRILAFMRLTHSFQQIKRVVRATGEMRWENDAEHSFQLAIVAWYVIDSKGLGLNLHKVFRYALVHDLPEIYAGDPCPFVDGPDAISGKKERERLAKKRLGKELEEFPDLFEALESYERFEDPESCFVYVLDKLIPIYNIMLDDGKTWRQFMTSMDEMLSERAKKVIKCPIGFALYQDIVEALNQNQGELFPPNALPLPQDQYLEILRPTFKNSSQKPQRKTA